MIWRHGLESCFVLPLGDIETAFWDLHQSTTYIRQKIAANKQGLLDIQKWRTREG